MGISCKLLVIGLLFWLMPAAFSQEPPASPAASPAVSPAASPAVTEDKRVLGVIPNYRTAEPMKVYKPITAGQKLTLAAKDSFDYPLVGLGAVFAGLYQASNSHPQFGQGTVGYFRRLGTAYGDVAIGNMMTEGFLPALLREDPHYFRMVVGSKKARTFYAVSRIFVTKRDSGRASFNFSEVMGNGIASGIGLAYYSDNRDLKDFSENWATQLGTDALSNVLKEFWPDIKQRFRKHRHDSQRTD